jgi:hypothetical protein
MALQLHEEPAEHLLEVSVSGKLTDDDYRAAAPAVNQFMDPF